MELAAPYARNLPRTDTRANPDAGVAWRALAACSDRQLLALIDATDTAPQVDPGWIVEFEAAMLLWKSGIDAPATNTDFVFRTAVAAEGGDRDAPGVR